MHHINAMHATSEWLHFFSPWMTYCSIYIPAKASSSVSVRVSGSGKFYFRGIWGSLHPCSTVRSLLCVCCIPYASCNAWVKVILSCARQHVMFKWVWPLKYHSYWTGRHQQPTNSERESIILLLQIHIKSQDREAVFIKTKWLSLHLAEHDFSLWLLRVLSQHHGVFSWRNSSAGEGHPRGIHPTSPSWNRTY